MLPEQIQDRSGYLLRGGGGACYEKKKNSWGCELLEADVFCVFCVQPPAADYLRIKPVHCVVA